MTQPSEDFQKLLRQLKDEAEFDSRRANKALRKGDQLKVERSEAQVGAYRDAAWRLTRVLRRHGL